MINSEQSFGIHDYIEILLRRVWYIVLPFVVVLTGTVLYAFYAPREYEASTLVLVIPQKVPEQFVHPTVTSKIEDRLHSISQEILSRTRLEQIISEFGLYPKEVKSTSMDEVIELMRKNIKIEIPKKEESKEKNYFTITYMGRNPKVVTAVTNKLASLFIEENLKFRELQAQGTSEFLSVELTATKAKLEEQESAITQFKKKFMGELPEQRDANLKVFEQLMSLYQRIDEKLRSSEDRKVLLKKQISDTENLMAYVSREGKEESHPPVNPVRPRLKDPQEIQLEQLKSHLVDLQGKYTERHPDIIIAKKKIADLEAKVEKAKLEREAEESSATSGIKETTITKMGDERDYRLMLHFKEIENQLVVTDREIQRLKEEEERVKDQMAKYRERVENTPIREQAMANLSRDYRHTKESYEKLLQKSQDAQQAENLERRQKGEQFRIIDPARIPEKPVKPNIFKVLVLGFCLAIASGFGLAFFREQLDHSFRDAEDLEATFRFKVLANIPKIEVKTV